MKIFSIIKSLLAILAIVFIFFDWRLAIACFLLASIVHVIPMGPNPLLSVITGYLIIGGVIYLFINWKIGIALIIGGLLVAKFRVYSNKCNYDYYEKNKKNKSPNTS